MSKPKATGDALEEAVMAIEAALLAINPAMQRANYVIEMRKVFVIDGVKHEVDVYVKVDLGSGYDTSVIFECKNWLEKTVGKNDIIIFSEKIKALGALKGYFVARRFGRYARAQAKMDRRIVLLRASDVAPIWPQLEKIHVMGRDRGHYVAQVQFIAPSDLPREEAVVESGPVTIDGVFYPSLNDYLRPLVEATIVERLATEPTHELPDGAHTLEVLKRFDFESALINGVAAAGVFLRIKFEIVIARPAIVSVFDVETRGRLYKTEITKLGPNYVSMTYVLPESVTREPG
ncbi:MAG: restriction endonuclease [Acidobacteriota bacterium]